MSRLFHWLTLAACLLGPASAQEGIIEVFPEEMPGEVGLTAWDRAQDVQFQRLVQSIETLPSVAAAWFALTSEDRRDMSRGNAEAGPGVPQQIGVVRPVRIVADFSMIPRAAVSHRQAAFSGGWLRRNEAGAIAWAVRMDFENVGAVRVHLTDLSLPEGVDLYLFNDEGDVRGPYGGTADSLWTHSISGERLYLQLDDRRGGDTVLEDARFQIKAVVLIEASTQAHCPINAPCVEDATCFGTSEWANIDVARRAIAKILYIQGGGAYICSGGLVNDTDPNTWVPYFLTANHCVSTQTVASTVETFFDYQTSSCGAPCPPHGTRSTLGATLLSTSLNDDHTLLRLNEPPPSGRIFLGWTTADIANSTTTLYRLSHPRGSPLAYSRHLVTPTSFTCTGSPRGRYIYSRNQVGAVEPGSSGSPVINESMQIVGQLFGGCGSNLNNFCDSTSNRIVDGAFRNYYPQVAQWLNPSGVVLSVNRAGTGTGTVTSTPAGINCGTGCSANFATSTVVALTARPATGSSFTGWSGDCLGTGTCTLTMDDARTVTAIFDIEVTVLSNDVPIPNLSGAMDSERFFTIEVPEGASNFVVTTSGGAGDVDLYLRFGAQPNLDEYDCRPHLPGNKETCKIPQPAAGRYHIMLHGWLDYVDVTLVASFNPPPGGCTYNDQLVLSDTVLTGIQTHGACRVLTAGPSLVVGAGAVVTFVAGERVVLRPGLAVEAGARLRVMIDTALY